MSNGLLPIITKPRVTSTTKSLIDNILTSNTQSIGTFVFRTNISDHFSVLLSRNVNEKEKTFETKYLRLINSKNICSFKENLASANQINIYELNEVEAIGDFFMDTLLDYFNTSFPIVKSRFKKGPIPIPHIFYQRN